MIIYVSKCFHYTNTRLPPLQSKIPEDFFRLLSTLVDVNVGTPDGTKNNRAITRSLSTCFEAYCHRSHSIQHEGFQLLKIFVFDTVNQVRNYVNHTMTGVWTGRRAPIVWPPRLPEWTTMDSSPFSAVESPHVTLWLR